MLRPTLTALLLSATLFPATAAAMPNQQHYYAHDAVADRHGVIAPWYRGQNGQLDLRVRIAAETLKRYPWALPPKSVAPAPEYVFSGAWKISAEGTITIPPINDWTNGDLGQRAFFTLTGLADYYRYSGDPAAIAHMSVMADTILDHCLTAPDHPWPNFFVSVPTKGKPYGKADPHGFIQLDLVAEVGLGLLRAYQVVGNERWLKTCRHWGDLFAERRNRQIGGSGLLPATAAGSGADPSAGALAKAVAPSHPLPPWPRYANPEDVGWEDTMTGGVACVLEFLDELIRLGYAGKDNAIVAARDAGRAYLRDVLLPRWTAVDAWGRNYWDWNCPVQDEITTETVCRYLMDHPDAFPNWRIDARNILSLFLNHTSVGPDSRGDVYHGAWAYPESSGCCGRSLWYAPMEIAPVFAQYGALANDAWARELARRQMILATYDVHETGVVEDNIDGGQVVAGDWFKIAHPMALRHALMQIAWQPEIFGAARENHIVRSSAVVAYVVYGDGRIAYATHDAPEGTTDVLRLAFRPTAVTAGGKRLEVRPDLQADGYVAKDLPGGDCLVTVRHSGTQEVILEGEDPQETNLSGGGGGAETRFTVEFIGNQVRLIGDVGPDEGLADVYIDGVKQLVGIDYWSPAPRKRQILYYRNGLPNGKHELKVVARPEKNPLSEENGINLWAVQSSSAAADVTFGEGGGPTGPQRMVFGYAGRADVVDSNGNAWRPGAEFIVRAGNLADSVAASWWTERRRVVVLNTPDPELYRYGVHGKEFTVVVTVGPGTYHVRLKFCETRTVAPKERAMSVFLNGVEVAAALDVAASAGGMHRAMDLVFNDVVPVSGVIAIRCAGREPGEAILQALEVGPGAGGTGATPVRAAE